MKKIVGIIAAAALVAGMATAQDDAGIRFGAWGRSIFSPVGYNGEDIITQGPQTSWGNPYRVGLGITGVSDHFGFEANPNFDKDNVGTHDMNYVWVKPFDFLRVDIGQVRDQKLQGDAGTFGAWNWVRNSGSLCDDESFTFTMLANGDDSQGIADGMIVKIDPMEALHIGVFIGAKGGTGYGAQKAEDTFAHYSAISAGYTVDGLGTFKLGFWEQETGKDDKGEDQFWGKGEVAFDLKAIENLTLSVGAKIPTGFVYTKKAGQSDGKLPDGYKKVTDDLYWDGTGVTATKPNLVGGVGGAAYTEPFQLNVYAGYQLMDNIKLHALVGTKLYKYLDPTDNNDDSIAFGARFGVGANIGIADGLEVLADVRVAMKQYNQGAYVGDEVYNSDCYIPVSFMVGILKSFSNGSVGIGFQGSVNDWFQTMDNDEKGYAYGSNGQDGEAADLDSFRFLVPIVLTYWF